MNNSTLTTQHRRGLAAHTREQAGALLERLLEDRAGIEQRIAERGKLDPIKDLTGSSALDRAIARTREMIRHMDELLAEMNEGETPRPTGNGRSNGVSRNGGRPGATNSVGGNGSPGSRNGH
jgi:hypothetical protein